LEAAPGAHGLEAVVAHGLAAFGAQGFAAGALAAQGFLVAQGLTGFAAHGLAVCGAQGFTGALAAQGLTGAQGFSAFGAQGLATAQGFAAPEEEVPKTWEANWSEGPSNVMAKSQGSREKSAPLSQFGPGSQEWKKRIKINARAMPLKR